MLVEKRNGIVDDNAVVGTIHKTKVADIYSNLQAIMQELQTKISKLIADMVCNAVKFH